MNPPDPETPTNTIPAPAPAPANTRHTSMTLRDRDLARLDALCAHTLTTAGIDLGRAELLRSLVRAEYRTPALAPPDFATLEPDPPGERPYPVTFRLTDEDRALITTVAEAFANRHGTTAPDRTTTVRALVMRAHRERCTPQPPKTARKPKGK